MITGRMKKRLFPILITGLLAAGFTPRLNAGWANEAVPDTGEAAPERALIAVDQLLVPVMQLHRVVEYMVVGISLEPAPAADPDQVRRNLPRVKDAFLREAYLYGKANSGPDNLDMEALRARLLGALAALRGVEPIAGIYFTSFISIKS